MQYSSSATRDFTTDFTSCGSQNIDTGFCRVRYASVSAKPARKWVPILCAGFWRATTFTCFCRSRQGFRSRRSCSASKGARRGASRWSFPSCASAIGGGGFGRGDISRPRRAMLPMISSCSIWNYIPNAVLPASAGSGSLMSNALEIIWLRLHWIFRMGFPRALNQPFGQNTRDAPIRGMRIRP